MASIATLVCIAAVLWLFWLDRDRGVRTSPALWIPTIWLLINGSRSISEWLHPVSGEPLVMQYSEGNPLDAAIFGALILAGIVALNFRTRRLREILRQNLPVILFFTYCALSILWSDYPFIALKRYIKAVGDLVMILVVITDGEPLAAIKRFFARVTFILMPASVLLILFYPALGTMFDPTERVLTYVGVTTFKNLLGVIAMVCGLSSLWSFLGAHHDRGMVRRRSHLLAHGLMVATAAALLVRCNSMTSLTCFGLGSVVMIMATQPWTTRKPRRIHLLVGSAIAIPLFTLFVSTLSVLIHALGRKSNLTDRTLIWQAVLAMRTNPFVGTGFESFWLGSHLQSVWDLSVQGIQEAHNGYIEIYINLGWFGLLFFGAMVIWAYPRIVATVRSSPHLGRLAVSYFACVLVYSLTEAGFRMMNPAWIVFLLAVASPALVFERQLSAQTAPSPLMRKAAAGQVRILQ